MEFIILHVLHFTHNVHLSITKDFIIITEGLWYKIISPAMVYFLLACRKAYAELSGKIYSLATI